MFRKFAGITLVILVILLIVREATEVKPGEGVPRVQLEIRAGGMTYMAIHPSDLVSDNESVEIQLYVKHISGGKAQVLIVDEENFNKANISPCWNFGLSASFDIACVPDYEAITPQLSFVDFQSEETTDWINVGHQTLLYMLVTNINNREVLHIEVEALYRRAEIDDDTL